MRMCDNCSEFQQLLYSVERQHEATIAGQQDDGEHHDGNSKHDYLLEDDDDGEEGDGDGDPAAAGEDADRSDCELQPHLRKGDVMTR